MAVGKYGYSTYHLSTEEGIAGETLKVHKGTYRIQARVIAPVPDNSFYMSIPVATTQKINHKCGRMMYKNMSHGSDWHWDGLKKYKHQTTGLVAPEFSIFTFQLPMSFCKEGGKSQFYKHCPGQIYVEVQAR